MHQISTLKKMNSYLCVIDTLKFRTRFLIMRHTITRVLARTLGIRSSTRTCDRRYVRIRKYKVSYPEGAAAAEMAIATADDVYVHRIQCHAAYVVTMYTSGSGTRPLAKSWELLASGTTRTIATLWRCWRWIRVVWLSFRLSHTPWLRSIADFVTSLNYASQILIMRHRAPCRILIYASPFKNNYFSGNA